MYNIDECLRAQDVEPVGRSEETGQDRLGTDLKIRIHMGDPAHRDVIEVYTYRYILIVIVNAHPKMNIIVKTRVFQYEALHDSASLLPYLGNIYQTT